VASIQSGQRVFMTGNASVPQKVMKALVTRAPQLRDVEIVQVLTIGPAEYTAPELQGHLRVNTLFISDNVRKASTRDGRTSPPVSCQRSPGSSRTAIFRWTPL